MIRNRTARAVTLIVTDYTRAIGNTINCPTSGRRTSVSSEITLRHVLRRMHSWRRGIPEAGGPLLISLYYGVSQQFCRTRPHRLRAAATIPSSMAPERPSKQGCEAVDLSSAWQSRWLETDQPQLKLSTLTTIKTEKIVDAGPAFSQRPPAVRIEASLVSRRFPR